MENGFIMPFPVNIKNDEEIITSTKQLIQDHAQKNFDKIKDKFDCEYEPSWVDYFRYILYSDINVYEPTYTLEYFQEQAIKKYCEKLKDSYSCDFLFINTVNGIYKEEPKIMGFYNKNTDDKFNIVYVQRFLQQRIILNFVLRQLRVYRYPK